MSLVADEFEKIQRHEHQSWTSILTGLELLEAQGLDPNLNKFKRLRHTRGAPLWELRAQGRPAYRVVLAPVGPDRYLLLSVVRKDVFARDSHRYIEEASARLRDWQQQDQSWPPRKEP